LSYLREERKKEREREKEIERERERNFEKIREDWLKLPTAEERLEYFLKFQ
jgi:hypothetical protein